MCVGDSNSSLKNTVGGICGCCLATANDVIDDAVSSSPSLYVGKVSLLMNKVKKVQILHSVGSFVFFDEIR